MSYKKKVGKYDIGNTIGEGTFAKVKAGVDTKTGEIVAIKVLDKAAIQKQNMGPQIKKEISIMKIVSHPNVVKLVEVLASRTKIYIVLEMVTGGELFDKIVAERRFSEDKARFYFRQLLAGVEYCHQMGVCHRDLKPENLLLDDEGNLKISDFGLSALYSGGTDEGMKLLHTTCGTPNYVAPEVLGDQGYDGRMADVWSCGVILYVLLAGFLPFDEKRIDTLFKKIQEADFSYPAWFSSETRSLIDKILIVDVSARLTLAQVKDHNWVTANGSLAFSGVVESHLGDPAELDVENAVKESSEEQETSEPKQQKNLIAHFNAFEMISHSGGLGLEKIFRKCKQQEVKRSHQFTSNYSPKDIMDRMKTIFEEMGCELGVFASSFKIKAALMTAKGMIGVVIQVYSVSKSLNMLEIRRGKGDILEYHIFFKDLENRLGDLINRP